MTPAAASPMFSSSNNSMVKNCPSDYKWLFLQEKESQRQAEASQMQAEASQRQAEASQRQAEASQMQAEDREREAQDEERQDRQRNRLTNFKEFLRYTHTYPRDR
ncbi:hypothetical protein N7466_002983 [Penicillium verhagenii]|uniref:uncharacterized protein n=1 Tax=Penicillium verhagenii TaxID=1562060 RepID=UPI002544D511|nr:uncharacterized protein N7466_002983 [Penicillium verhagenii]KAJ5936533.1 hypothetical protein N7466_002983 [Penicillium verhagenii]